MAKIELAPLVIQWGRTEMGEFYIRFARPIQIGEQLTYDPFLGGILSEEDFDKLKASVNAPRGLTIAKALPKNGQGLKLVQ